MGGRIRNAWPALALLVLLGVVAFVWYHSLTSPRDFLVHEFTGRLVCPNPNLIHIPEQPQFTGLATSNGVWALDLSAYAWERSNSQMRELFRSLNGRMVVIRGRWSRYHNTFMPGQPARWIISVVDIRPAPPGTPPPSPAPRPTRPNRPNSLQFLVKTVGDPAL